MPKENVPSASQVSSVTPSVPSPVFDSAPKPVAKYLLVGLGGVLLISSLIYIGYYLGQRGVTTNPSSEEEEITTTPKNVFEQEQTTKEDETAEWQTYTNQTLGYTLRIPSDMAITEDSRTEGVTHFGPVDSPPNFEISSSESRLYADSVSGYEVGPYPAYAKFNTADPTGVPHHLVEAILEFEHSGAWYWVHVVYFTDADTLAIPEDIAESLTTFRFLEQEGVDETVGWKIYVNEEYDYSIKYPPVWSYEVTNYTGYEHTITFGESGIGDVTFYINEGDETAFIGEDCAGWLASYKGEGYATDSTIIDGIEAFRVHLNVEGPAQNPPMGLICFEKDGIAYEFKCVDGRGGFSERTDLMLSTFRFLD